MTSSFLFRLVLLGVVLTMAGCHSVLRFDIACEPADEATCPTDMHCAAGTCVDGAPRCGDGDVTGSETCDDGNDFERDGCSSNCTAVVEAVCGNNVVEDGEVCDDGNTVEGDGCTSLCELSSVCGDGVTEQDEVCDDGNVEDDDSCSADCLTITAVCGNTIVEEGEDCDDGDAIDDDECDNTCTAPFDGCGDGNIDPGEDCDDGNITDDDTCSNTCQENVDAVCGDGVREGAEACDDGDDIDNNTCANDCTLSPNCGNGEIDAGEACDPFANDCNFDCTLSVCGDGQVGTDESCDDNAQETASCTALCTAAAFNNGRIDPGLAETCDDGNTNANDRCHDGALVNVSSCADIHSVAPGLATGAYTIDVDNDGPLPATTVHCDMSFDGGGWTRVLLTNIDLALAQLPEGDTSEAGRLSTAHVAALARRSQQVHIRTLDDEARSVTSVPAALPIHRLRLGASLTPTQPVYPLAQVNVDWTGPFASRLATSTAPAHTAWPEVYEAAGNPQGLQLFDNGTRLVSRWQANAANEPIEVWLRPVEVCGDGVVQGDEACDDGNAIEADGCSRCTSDTCVNGASSAAVLPTIGRRTMLHSADLDDDGFKDVVVVELVSNTPTVSVARGSAFGLQRAVPVVLANMPDALTDPVVGGVGGSEVIDVDGDTTLDLVLFDQFNCTFQVFRGTGAGAFIAPPIQSPALSIGSSVCGNGDVSASSQRTHLGALFDVDRDGLLDAVLPSSDGALRVVFQQAGGQFATNPALLTLDVGNTRCTPQQVIAADVIGTGQPSLVVACTMVLETEQQLLIVLAQTAAGFVPHQVPVDAQLTDLLVADVNGDGFNDLIGTGTRTGQKVTRVLRNDRNFAFTTVASLNGNGDRLAINDERTALGLGIVGGTAFLRVAIGGLPFSLTPASSSGPVVTDYAAPAFVDADGLAGTEYISAADGRVFIERQGNSCTVTP